MKININNLEKALKEVYWEYDFKISVHKDGSAHLEIPDFIVQDLESFIEKGYATPKSEVASRFLYKGEY